MQISEVRLKKRDGDDKFLASGSITFEGMFVVSGIKVMRAKVETYLLHIHRGKIQMENIRMYVFR